jgi:hypothetical protein
MPDVPHTDEQERRRRALLALSGERRRPYAWRPVLVALALLVVGVAAIVVSNHGAIANND